MYVRARVLSIGKQTVCSRYLARLLPYQNRTSCILLSDLHCKNEQFPPIIDTNRIKSNFVQIMPRSKKSTLL